MHFTAVLELAEATSAPTTKAATDAALGPRYAPARTAVASAMIPVALGFRIMQTLEQLSRTGTPRVSQAACQKSDSCDSCKLMAVMRVRNASHFSNTLTGQLLISRAIYLLA